MWQQHVEAPSSVVRTNSAGTLNYSKTHGLESVPLHSTPLHSTPLTDYAAKCVLKLDQSKDVSLITSKSAASHKSIYMHVIYINECIIYNIYINECPLCVLAVD